ncbi:phage tail terminator-like protein [Roseibium aggregatum]|uniref:Gp37 protein n=1 Tax=Roseibium aggregatum TaxID=187304 RepID=A0A0M6Y8N0_9HYPH|nr:phage tail terminator-like protein [Roseibium aggregatum]CTQ45769.1 hypothetical protein LAL4801_04224 [Roseibium aggregatum]
MSVATIRREIEGVFGDEFPSAYPNVAITYENTGFDHDPESFWLRLTIRTNEPRRQDIGASKGLYLTTGVALFQIFVPVGQGTGEGLEIADAIDDIFRARETEHIRFRASTAIPVGVSNSWYQVNVSVPFRAYFFK